MELEALKTLAVSLLEKAYCPYSHSPVGAALIGHAVGDKVEITLPNGATICYEVLDISRSAI